MQRPSTKLASLAWLVLVLSSGLCQAQLTGAWFVKPGVEAPCSLVPAEDGLVQTELGFTGSCLLYLEKDRQRLRPSAEELGKGSLSLQLKADWDGAGPLQANLFVQDKDGAWFQSQESVKLEPGRWQMLRVGLAATAHELVPVGHESTWSALHAASLHTVGVSIYGPPADSVRLACRKLGLTGRRPRPELSVHHWRLPSAGEAYETIESHFELSREYANVYDPDEIQVDVEASGPSGRVVRFPAFFTQDYRRHLHYNREIVRPIGKPHWAFRFTPPVAGEYQLRLVVVDRSGEEPETVSSPWRVLQVSASERPGYVRVSGQDPRFFELTTGQFFYPIGFNLHTIKDVRSEKRLNLGVLPDKGTYSFDEYFEQMQANGVNAAEIWMASWSLALEWSSARRDYYGLGRYSLANAWKLDYVLNTARDRGIYVHLVLDNHGKMSSHSDQEWSDSPHNLKTDFAAADGACLNQPVEFFDNAQARRYYRNRNRYIAARWGAQTNIFGIEFWSEGDLITNMQKAYDDGRYVDWHRQMAREFRELDQGEHLLTTHFCGDYNKEIKYRNVCELPELAYVVADAYRGKTPFVEHMIKHQEALKIFGKPLLVTEFGGTSQAGDYALLRADLHGGLWAAFFTGQAGTPFLWWHAFIHKLKHYQHFKGLAAFMEGIDPRGKEYVFGQAAVGQTVVGEEAAGPNPDVGCLTAGNSQEFYGWIYHKQTMVAYPESAEELPEITNQTVAVQGLGQADYLVRFFDTVSGQEVVRLTCEVGEAPLQLAVPAFRGDLAFKVAPAACPLASLP